MIKYLRIGGMPNQFQGKLRLPPSKSYMHRAMFIASLAMKPSEITGCGSTMSDDVLATIGALRVFGIEVKHSPGANGTLRVLPGETSRSQISVFARGSGTTARFTIGFAALAKEGAHVRISGDNSLSRRPMESILESLSELGVNCYYENEKGKLPITIEGGGIRGGECTVDGSISSQFISSLLISCTKARNDCTIRIKDPSKLVSKPYIDATLAMLSYFGLKVKPISSKLGYSSFRIKANQRAKPRKFSVPGDMSTAAALIGTTLATGGTSELLGVNSRFPQSDSAMIQIARKFGASIRKTGGSMIVKSERNNFLDLEFDLKESPDIVPVVVGLAAALGRQVEITNVGHLRFKESDRISVLSRELKKLGVRTRESSSTLSILGKVDDTNEVRKPILINPEKDHRMLMAIAIAALSGRYGEIMISDPDCVGKSYPAFVNDLQKLCHEKKTVKIVEVSR
jgi:3-phosphoshikimate 1-carboxyvinyltransferase